MNLTRIELLVMIVDAALALTALVAFFARGIQSKWPLVTTFLFIRIASEVALLSTAHHRYREYFYTYWTCAGIQFLCQFGILFEVCRDVLSSFPAIPRGFLKSVVSCVTVTAILSTWISVQTHGTFSAKMVAFSVGMQRTALMAWCACFVVCAAFTSWMGLAWKKDTILIGAGSVAMNASGMVAAFLYGLISIKHSTIVDNVATLIDLSVFLLWLVSLKPPKDTRTIHPPDLESIESLKAIAHSTLGISNT